MTFMIHDDGLHVRQGFDKPHSRFNPHNKYPCVQPICPDAFAGYDRNTLAAARWLERARIENMMISDPPPLEETFIIPGC